MGLQWLVLLALLGTLSILSNRKAPSTLVLPDLLSAAFLLNLALFLTLCMRCAMLSPHTRWLLLFWLGTQRQTHPCPCMPHSVQPLSKVA